MEPTGFVTSSDGTRIAVYVSGPAQAETTVLAVHGYPDNAGVWDGVTDRLASGYRVVRYDVRGAGRSDQPAGRSAYRYARLVEDARAVLDAYSPDRPVHLLGHDWGSVQGWQFVAEPGLADRFTGFTSVSGPSVAYLRAWIRTNLAARNYQPVLRQLLHSSYIGFFQTPVLPELAWRSGIVDRVLGAKEPAARRGLADKLNGLQLYRANLLSRSGEPARPVSVPVQVIAPLRDPFISVDVALQTPRPYVADLEERTVDAGHWLPLTDPDYLADAVADFVQRRS